MKIEDRQEGDVTIVTFKGELDAANLGEVKEQVEQLIHKGHSNLVFNLAGLTFVNSSGLGYLIQAHKHAREQDGEVVLSQPSNFVQITIKTLGIDQIFAIYGSDEESVAHFQGEESVEEQHFEGARVDASLLGSTDLRFALSDEPDRFAEGRILSIYEDGLTFKYPADPDRMSIDPDDLQLGGGLHLEFQQPFLDKERAFKMEADIVFAVDLDDESTKFRLQYTKIDEEDRKVLEGFVKDQDLFRSEGRPESAEGDG